MRNWGEQQQKREIS